MSYHEFKSLCGSCYGKGEISQHENEDSKPVFIGNVTCPECNGNGKLEYGSFETFLVTWGDLENEPDHFAWDDIKENGLLPQDVTGWYWQACFPGCLPDSDPIGPFETENEAIQDAQNY